MLKTKVRGPSGMASLAAIKNVVEKWSVLFAFNPHAQIRCMNICPHALEVEMSCHGSAGEFMNPGNSESALLHPQLPVAGKSTVTKLVLALLSS